MLKKKVKNLLKKLDHKNYVIVTAESITAGLVSSSISSVAGASRALWGGFVSYSNTAKQILLGVSEQTLENFGTVSKETVEAMAKGALEKTGANCALALSGIAGPTGGSEQLPVGTVWICFAIVGPTITFYSRSYIFTGRRNTIRRKAAFKAIDLAIEHLDTL